MATDMRNYEKYGGGSEISLKGIVKLEKDEQGKVGLEIPDLLTINNQEYQAGSESLGTNGNLCLLDDSADLLRINPVPVTLTYVGILDGAKIYTDDQGLKYIYTNEGSSGYALSFIGDTSMETLSLLPISQAPTWKSNSTFLLGDTQEVVPLEGIFGMLFSTQNNSTIIIPKTLEKIFLNIDSIPTTLQNFSGTLDTSAVTFEDENFQNIGTGCTEGTILVNETTYTNLGSRISSGVLDGKIKIQQAEGQ